MRRRWSEGVKGVGDFCVFLNGTANSIWRTSPRDYNLMHRPNHPHPRIRSAKNDPVSRENTPLSVKKAHRPLHPQPEQLDRFDNTDKEEVEQLRSALC